MQKKQFSTVEKNIYVEHRCGAFRFKVVVHPLKDSATFSVETEGLALARQRRVDLLRFPASFESSELSNESKTPDNLMSSNGSLVVVEALTPGTPGTWASAPTSLAGGSWR